MIDTKVKSELVNTIVELIRNNQKDIVGAYVVPFSFGEVEKLQVTFVENSEREVIENRVLEIGGVSLIINSNPWSTYQQEKEFDDSFYTGNYLQVRDLKNAEIVYDPEHLLADKKEELRKKPGTLTYYNLSVFFKGVIKQSRDQLQKTPEIVDEKPLEVEEPKKKERNKKKKVIYVSTNK